MQIFRVDADHKISAQYLDNRRLSKQVLELYQIIRVCLAELKIIEGNTRYLHHPIVKQAYNNGKPYIIDLYNMLVEMDLEHQRRGGKRSPAFKEDLDVLADIIFANQEAFSHEPLPPYYVYGDTRLEGETVYEAYQQLLHDKWLNDTTSPRCGFQPKKTDV
ncbi:pyrimidine dimer DNA glycosylase/endonuclease V [Macrococcus brunensis]|uniref:pyrimidine dimer DNA glycosylase/endonuclease V n=1 Tax=Macrococcus brunensis TaxID=198483 RepID=UPI001EF15559|nr:pyrimidine dimer DNA glycosylase/endonuclease V [Macrococcus brunensis]ULG72022.1 pyrimidine dimer DNA glycosylase/endonuclease V [Macrococcus brunensis]